VKQPFAEQTIVRTKQIDQHQEEGKFERTKN
jgi:hypothetical protein